MEGVYALDVPHTTTGESPVWCDRTRSLWYVDIHQRTLWQYWPENARHRHWVFDELVCSVALTDGNHVLVALADAICVFDPDTGRIDRKVPLQMDGRLNDGAVSRGGILHVAALTSTPPHNAALYQWRDGHPIKKAVSGLRVGNGVAFSPCDTTMYLSDSHPQVSRIWAFTHDPATGELSNRRVFFDMPVEMGRPDGGAVDAQGGYWSAAIDGGAIVRFLPDGSVDRIIHVPVKKPTKICFGGNDLQTIYVTSIDTGSGGTVLSLDLGITGLAEPRLCLTRRTT